MANEITISGRLIVNNGNLQYSSQPSQMQVDQAVAFGPSPGAIYVTIYGTDVSLAQFTTPGEYWFQNFSDTYTVEYGFYDGVNFIPWGELLPGAFTQGRFSRNLLEEYVGTGTGTSAPINTLRFKARGGTAKVRCDIFEA